MGDHMADVVRRADCAIAVIDIQERLADAMSRRDAVVTAAAKLLRAGSALGLPIVVTRQYPKGLGDTVPELAEVLGEVAGGTSPVIDKTAFCACGEPAFIDALAATGRSQVVLLGMETHICVTQTALALLSRGLGVFVAADACCSMRAEDHDIALERLRSAGVVVTTSESVMYEAVAQAGTDDFRRLLQIVKGETRS